MRSYCLLIQLYRIRGSAIFISFRFFAFSCDFTVKNTTAHNSISKKTISCERRDVRISSFFNFSLFIFLFFFYCNVNVILKYLIKMRNDLRVASGFALLVLLENAIELCVNFFLLHFSHNLHDSNQLKFLLQAHTYM